MLRISVIVLVVALGGCVEGGDSGRIVRWPQHRKDHDSQLAALRDTVAKQQLQIEAIAAEVSRLEHTAGNEPATPTPVPVPVPVDRTNN